MENETPVPAKKPEKKWGGKSPDSPPSRVYKFDLVGQPMEGKVEFEEALFGARMFHNTLIGHSQKTRAEFKAFLQDKSPDIAAIDEKIDGLEEQIEKQRAAINNKKKIAYLSDAMLEDIESEKAAIKVLESEIKKLRATRKPLYEVMKVTYAAEIKALNEKGHGEYKKYAAETDVYWGTKAFVVDAWGKARFTPAGAKFRRWDGRGMVGGQIRNINAKTLFEPNFQIVITKSDPATFRPPGPRVRPITPEEQARQDIAIAARKERLRLKGEEYKPRSKLLDTVRLRIDTGPKRTPVWVKFAFRMHRDLPADAEVVSASINRRPEGPYMAYALCLTVNSRTHAAIPKPIHEGARALAIDVGYRKKDDELRFGYTFDGVSGKEMRLGNSFMERYRQAEKLRSTRDLIFNDVKKTFSLFLTTSGIRVPAGIKKKHTGEEDYVLAHMHTWKTPQRLYLLVQDWKLQRFPGDDVIFNVLLDWSRRENHLYRYETGLRSSVLDGRREEYRIISKAVATTYTVIFLEKIDLRHLAKRKPPEKSEKDLHQAARHQRFQVALSEFRGTLEKACKKTGTQIIYVEPALTTMNCWKCSNTEYWDMGKELVHTCSKCSSVWDQDYNGARNIYALGKRSLNADGAEGIVVAQGSGRLEATPVLKKTPRRAGVLRDVPEKAVERLGDGE